jgi:ATP-dependent helicase/DNAse subunit B
MRHNLRPKVSSQGINFNLSFGTAVHAALEYMYKTGDPKAVDVFVGEWTQLTNTVKKLNEGFFYENEEQFAYHMDLGQGMLRFYTEWAKLNDDFEVVNTEHLFSVPTGQACDIGPRKNLPVYYRGRMDMVVRDKRTDRYGVMDHKTSSRHDDEDFLLKLDMDEQVTRYMWAAQEEADLYDLPYKKIDFVLYNVLFKAYPKPPTMTTRDLPSLDRQKEMTTSGLFSEVIMRDEALKQWFIENEKAQSYYEWLKEIGDKRFIHRELVKRNDYELRACGDRIKMEIEDMLSPNLNIYPNATGEWYCIKCPFRGPCLATNDGTDVQYMLDINYEPNMDSEGHYTSIAVVGND